MLRPAIGESGASRPTRRAERQGILLLSQVFPPAVGGSGELLDNIYARIRGVPVRVWTDAGTSAGSTRAHAMSIRRTTIDGHRWGVADPRSLRQHVRLARDILHAVREQPAVVHCARAQPEALPALLASKLSAGVRYLFWVHGEDISTAQTSREFAWTMRRVHAGASLAIANSQNSARVLAGTGFDAARIRVVYPGVDGDRFHPDLNASELRARFCAPPGRLLVSIGRLQRRKGHDAVLSAMHTLARELPDLVYVIVGDGAERGRLETMARELRLRDRVHFEGEASREYLPYYYAAADVFVMPTRVDAGDFEGFGLVFLEAAAAGRPTIGGRNGGVPEAVADGETGLLVDEEEGSLTQAIRTLVSSRELRHQFGHAGRTRALRQFTWERAADAVLAIHAEVEQADCTAASALATRRPIAEA